MPFTPGAGERGPEIFISNEKIQIRSFPPEIEILKNEILSLQKRVSEIEAKTRLISIDEEKGVLKIGTRTYFFKH